MTLDIFRKLSTQGSQWPCGSPWCSTIFKERPDNCKFAAKCSTTDKRQGGTTVMWVNGCWEGRIGHQGSSYYSCTPLGTKNTIVSRRPTLGPTLKVKASVEGCSTEALIDTDLPVSLVSINFLLHALIKNLNSEITQEVITKLWRQDQKTRNLWWGTLKVMKWM